MVRKLTKEELERIRTARKGRLITPTTSRKIGGAISRLLSAAVPPEAMAGSVSYTKKGEKGDPLRSATGEILFDVGTGAQCAQCHMPGRVYMGNDYRPDHGFRIPRPDLSIRIGVPNACNRCHVKASNQWSQKYITKWYGTKYKPHWGTIIDAGRKRIPEAQKELIRLGGDRLYPTNARATAMSLLGAYSDTLTVQAF